MGKKKKYNKIKNTKEFHKTSGEPNPSFQGRGIKTTRIEFPWEEDLIRIQDIEKIFPIINKHDEFVSAIKNTPKTDRAQMMCINKLPKIKEDIYVRDKFVVLKLPEFIKKKKEYNKMQEMSVSIYNLLNEWINSLDKESSENIKYELSDKFTVTQEPFGELPLSKFLNDYYKNIKE